MTQQAYSVLASYREGWREEDTRPDSSIAGSLAPIICSPITQELHIGSWIVAKVQ